MIVYLLTQARFKANQSGHPLNKDHMAHDGREAKRKSLRHALFLTSTIFWP